MSRSRDRAAPMDFAYDSPRDPGIFGLLPNKRVHLETLDGQSTWAPSPQNTAHAPANAPLLFSSTSKATFGFSQYQHTPSRNQQAGSGAGQQDENRMMVDEADFGASGSALKKQKHAELMDVEMENVESPIRAAQPSSKAADGASIKVKDVAAPGASSPDSVAPRPVSLNAVKKTAKQLRQAQVEQDKASDMHGGQGSRDAGRKGKGRGAGGDESLVLWAEEGDNDATVEGDDSIDSESSPLLSRLRRRRSLRRSNLRNDDRYAQDPSQSSLTGPQYHGNQYHLHMPSGGDMGLAIRGPDGERERERGGIKHSELPYIFLGYLQFVFNAGVVAIGLYLVITFILTIRHDVKQKMGAFSSEIMQEISTCTSLYIVNRCEPASRIPAMETACTEWEACMGRDPTVVGHARVGALTFANVITTFVDELSWKTIFFILAFSTCLIFITNSALFNLRAKHAGTHAPPHPSNAHPGAYGPPQQQQFHWPPTAPGAEKALT